MKYTTKGSAAVEFVLIFPVFLLVLCSFYQLFHVTTRKEFELIADQQEQKINLKKLQQAQSILEKPCVVHPSIAKLCEEMKQ